MKTNIQKKPIEIVAPAHTGLIIEAIQDLKGHSIVRLDLSEIEEAVCQQFIICEGNSTTHVKSIADNVAATLKKELNERPLSIEGGNGTEWVLVDYVDTVVHVFLKEKRAFYKLEELWSDAKLEHYEDLE